MFLMVIWLGFFPTQARLGSIDDYYSQILYAYIHHDIICEVFSIINFKYILSVCTWTLAFLCQMISVVPSLSGSNVLSQLFPSFLCMRSRWEFHHPAYLATLLVQEHVTSARPSESLPFLTWWLVQNVACTCNLHSSPNLGPLQKRVSYARFLS